jgi:ACS family tartrate transporter-like MFS transporter
VVAIPELLVTTAGYAYLFWGPILIRDALQMSNTGIGMLGGAIAIVSAGAMLLAGASSDRHSERVMHSAVLAAVVGASAIAAAFVPGPVGKIVCIILMQVAVISFLAPFWAIPTLLLGGTSAAVGIALVNAIGNIGGFIGPFVIGFLRTRTGGDNGAFIALGVMALVASGILATLRSQPAFARGREQGQTVT